MKRIKVRAWDGHKMHYPETYSIDAEAISFAPENSGGGLLRTPFENVMLLYPEEKSP